MDSTVLYKRNWEDSDFQYSYFDPETVSKAREHAQTIPDPDIPKKPAVSDFMRWKEHTLNQS